MSTTFNDSSLRIQLKPNRFDFATAIGFDVGFEFADDHVFSWSLFPHSPISVDLTRHISSRQFHCTQKQIDGRIDMIENSIHSLLEQVNDTGAEYPNDRSLAELIVEQCAKTPNNVAAVCNDQIVDFRGA